VELIKTTFDNCDINDLIFFKNEFSELIICYKLGINEIKLYNEKERKFLFFKLKRRKHYTGQYHNVYKIKGFISQI